MLRRFGGDILSAFVGALILLVAVRAIRRPGKKTGGEDPWEVPMGRAVTLVSFLALLAAPAIAGEATTLVLSFEVDEELWATTDWAEPPQLALWLESETTGTVRTLFVTRRTARDEWDGQTEVPASLPYWVTRYQREFDRDRGPTPEDPLPDALTGATPKRAFSHTFEVPEGDWSLYLEVNASGDYNPHYERVETDGVLADFGAGQPSLVYRATDITGPEGVEVRIVGQTSADTPPGTLVAPRHITSADRLIRRIELKRGAPRKATAP